MNGHILNVFYLYRLHNEDTAYIFKINSWVSDIRCNYAAIPYSEQIYVRPNEKDTHLNGLLLRPLTPPPHLSYTPLPHFLLDSLAGQ